MAGYIGSQTPVVSNGSQRKYTFTATAAQTVFTGMDIPNPQQIQVFQNGVRLVITTDYTVSSGTTVTLVNAASAGDSLVVILFADYQLLDTDALTFTGGTTIEGGLTVDNDGATVLTVDRATSDGDIAAFYKDSTKVGSIGTASSNLSIDSGSIGRINLDGLIRVIASKHSAAPRVDAITDAATDLGSTVNRFKDLYLSGGVYLGGTGAANYLDDYEEGTWTPVDASGAGLTFVGSGGRFVRIGSVVNFAFRAHYPSTSDGSSATIGGLPFTGAATTGSFDIAGGWTSLFSQNFNASLMGYVPISSTNLKIISQSNPSTILSNANVSSYNIYGFGTYYIP